MNNVKSAPLVKIYLEGEGLCAWVDPFQVRAIEDMSQERFHVEMLNGDYFDCPVINKETDSFGLTTRPDQTSAIVAGLITQARRI